MSRFQFVDDYSETYTVKRLCHVPGLHRSSFYRWRAGTPARRQRQHADEALVAQIRDYHDEFDATIGVRRMTAPVQRAIATIPDNGWQTIQYPDAIFDEDTKRWISVAEVAEVPFTAFASQKKAKQIPGRLVVRRIPELNKKDADQPGLFDLHRFHAVFTTSDLDTVTADKTHRQHAVIEQVNADLKASALAHLPSGKFTANAAWLVCAVTAFNLTHTAGAIVGTGLARAATTTIRRRLVTVPVRIARSARRLVLHLPEQWKWQPQWTRLFDHGHSPPAATAA